MSIDLDLEDWQRVKQALLNASMREGEVSIALQVPKNTDYDRLYKAIDGAITQRYTYGNYTKST